MLDLLAGANKDKRIYWNGNQDGTAVFLIGYCPDTLDYFNAMAEEARVDFPSVRDGDITCGKVTKSRSVRGFTLILFKVAGPRREIPGWSEYDRAGWDFHY